jgi:hypothetical protein
MRNTETDICIPEAAYLEGIGIFMGLIKALGSQGGIGTAFREKESSRKIITKRSKLE